MSRSKRRKLSLVEELVQTYDIQDTYLDSTPSMATDQASIERMVLTDKKKDVRGKPELYQDSVDVISSLSEMKGEVRREIEVMNMKMTQLESQVATIIDLLKSQGHLHSRASGSLNESATPPSTVQSPVKETKRKQKKTPPIDSNTKLKASKSQDEDPLPDWLARRESASSNHSIPDWEEEEAAEKSAAKKLNNSSGTRDAKLLQTLSMMKKK